MLMRRAIRSLARSRSRIPGRAANSLTSKGLRTGPTNAWEYG